MARVLVFDAYGTLFDVHSVQARCETYWPGQSAPLSRLGSEAPLDRLGIAPDGLLAGLGEP